MKYLLIFLALLLAACSGSPRPVSNPGPAAVQVSADGKHASESSIAATPDGRIFVVWSERDADRKHDIFIREFDTNLAPKAAAVRVNPDPGQSRTWFGDGPSVLVSPEGKIYVAWNRTYPDGPGNDLVLSTSADGGKTFGEPLKINDDSAAASHGMHGMAIDSRGRVLISWLDERYLKRAQAKVPTNSGGPFLSMFFRQTPTPAVKQPASEEPDAELYFAIVADGKLDGPNRKISAEICPCCRVSVAAAADGSVYIAFRKVWPGQFRHISIVSSTDGGATFSQPTQVSDDKWKLYACPISGAAIRAKGSELEIAWFSGGERAEKGVYKAVSTDRGTSFSQPALISKTMIKGTPSFAGDQLVFATPEKTFVITANSEKPLADGTAPTSAIASGKTITTLAKSINDQYSIWLVRSE